MPEVADLNFRSEAVGGPIDIARAWLDEEMLRSKPHLIVLLHGYNNTRGDAERAYTSFISLQQGLVSNGGDWAPGATVVRVFWPGDANWGLVSFGYYPWAVTRAQSVGAVLASLLDDLGRYGTGRLVVDFVAHSLGNRVLLRALGLIGSNRRLWVRRVVHMAAAVPTWKLEDPSDPDHLMDGLHNEAGTEGRVKSLYSGADRVLSYAFPLGETLSPEREGPWPTALGHEYWGGSISNFEQAEAKGADHGYYWGSDPATPASLRAWIANTVQRQLDLSGSTLRSTPTSLLSAASPMQSRNMTMREIPERSAKPVMDQ